MLPGAIAYLDVETTGADPREDRVTEVGLVEVVGGEIVGEWSTLVNPGRRISPGIEALTGISNEMVSRAPSFADISLDLAARLGGRLLVAHNARFDYGFLRNEFRRAGLPYQSDVLCTVKLSRALFPGEQRHNLDALIHRFQLSCAQRHRALADARVLFDLTAALSRAVPVARFRTAVEQAMQRPTLPPGVPAQLLEELPDAPGTYLFYDAEGNPLYAGKAANLRAQVLADLGSNAAHARALRTAAEAGTLEWRVTAGALGAALGELRLIESHAPRHNRSPRLRRDAFALHWRPEHASQVSVVDLHAESATMADLFGPFRSRADALAALRGLAREHGLCAVALGLESGSGPCSGLVAGTCRGACVGRESHMSHLVRLGTALSRLRIAPWPFPGPIAILDEDEARTVTEYHVACEWRYLGSARSADELHELARSAARLPPFDIDAYRILQRALRDRSTVRIIPLVEQ
jgi:DNA polymerase-3 subunit epsilon